MNHTIMTHEQINEKIAEIFDWKKVPEALGVGWWFRPRDPGVQLRRISPSCPDYCNDLNAMHDAEKTLDGTQAGAFHDWLETLQDRDRQEDCPASLFWYHATARQRAEAFLRTLNLWEE